MGSIIANQQINVVGYQIVFGELGSALAFNINGDLVVINYNLLEFVKSQNHASPA